MRVPSNEPVILGGEAVMRWEDMVPQEPKAEARGAVQDVRITWRIREAGDQVTWLRFAKERIEWAGLMTLIWLVGGGDA